MGLFNTFKTKNKTNSDMIDDISYIAEMHHIQGPWNQIVWFIQTKIIRIFTPVNDEDLLKRYAESVIRRNFGTPDAMKKAKPAT